MLSAVSICNKSKKNKTKREFTVIIHFELSTSLAIRFHSVMSGQ